MANACESCSVSTREFHKIVENPEAMNEFLVRHNVLITDYNCPKCHSACTYDRNRQLFRCRKTDKKSKSKCDFSVTIYKNTFFDNVKLSLDIICLLVLHWLTRDPPREEFLEELNISRNTIVDWCSLCREVLINWMCRNHNMIGGQNVVVEIDEAKLGERKHNTGRIVKGQWIFGGLERENPNEMFCVPVENRSADTLISILKRFVRPGSIVMSDCWRAYANLDKEGWQHFTVNHSLNFVNPDTGAHTQNIERSWREVRSHVPRYGRKEAHFAGYLAEALFKRRHTNYKERLHHFWKEASILYVPLAEPNDYWADAAEADENSTEK